MRPSLNIVSDQLIGQILDEARRILSEIGIEVRGAALRQRLLRVIDAAQDSVRMYRLCGGCQTTVERFGVAEPIDEPGLLII